MEGVMAKILRRFSNLAGTETRPYALFGWCSLSAKVCCLRWSYGPGLTARCGIAAWRKLALRPGEDRI